MSADLVDVLHAAEDRIGFLTSLLAQCGQEVDPWCRPGCGQEVDGNCDDPADCGCPCHDAEAIEPGPRCPSCGSQHLGSMEVIGGTAGIVVDEEGYWAHDGYTDVDWDSSTTEGWCCRACGWEVRDPAWIERWAES
jgi:hypothetical protein